MSKNTVTIPKTANAARKQIIQIDAAERLGGWHKAAICYAYRAKHYDKTNDMRTAEQAASEDFNMPGYAPRTVAQYASRWKKAGLADIRPGDEVELPDLEWESVTGGEVHPIKNVKPEHVEAVVEAAKSRPEIAKVMADAIVKDDDDFDRPIERAIDQSREEHLEENGVTPVSKSKLREPHIAGQALVQSITDALGTLHRLSGMINYRIEHDPDFTAGIREGFYEQYVSRLEGYHELLRSQLTDSSTEGGGDWDQALADLMANMEGGE